tara:strand:+ start:238 stop:525 length:288 start_codon:yes stop_codon:yes gene_type:complete
MKKFKVISLVSLVVLCLSTISCSKDEDMDGLCINEVAGLAYRGEVDDILAKDGGVDVEGRWTRYSPVCGCDGKSYNSDHFAKLEGVVSFTNGKCK